LNDIHLVIRTTGERTASVAKKLAIVSGLVENEVTVVNEIFFEVALRACYEEAIRVGRKWIMTLDADVLLTDTAVRRLLGLAEQMPSHFFQIEGKVFDKITGIYRQAGHRIYRTELLPLALEHIPAAGAQIRPELHTITQMVELGYPSRVVPSLVGVHDFEQYYADLYRKSLVHACKKALRVVAKRDRSVFTAIAEGRRFLGHLERHLGWSAHAGSADYRRSPLRGSSRLCDAILGPCREAADC